METSLAIEVSAVFICLISQQANVFTQLIAFYNCQNVVRFESLALLYTVYIPKYNLLWYHIYQRTIYCPENGTLVMWRMAVHFQQEQRFRMDAHGEVTEKYLPSQPDQPNQSWQSVGW